MAAAFAVVAFPLTFYHLLSIAPIAQKCLLDWKLSIYYCNEDIGLTGMQWPTLKEKSDKALEKDSNKCRPRYHSKSSMFNSQLSSDPAMT